MDEKQVTLLNGANIEGMFVYLFYYPICPYYEKGVNSDTFAYAIVASYPEEDPRSQQIPSWFPKEAFYKLADIYGHLSGQ